MQGFVIMGKTEPEMKQWLYYQAGEFQEHGTVVTWSGLLIDKEGHYLPEIFITREAATNIMNLVAGTMTDLDYKILCFIGQNKMIPYNTILKTFKKAGDSVSKFLRNYNVIQIGDKGKEGLVITPAGEHTIKRFNYGERTLSNVPMKVVTLKEAIESVRKYIPIIKSNKL